MKLGKLNRIVRSQPVRGEVGYFYGFKARALRHHCLGYGTFTVDMGRLEALRKEYSRRVQPITYLPLFAKATGLAVERNPDANAILFKKLWGYRIVRFEKVDVNVPITREVDGRTITFIGTLRDTPAKSIAAIQDELSVYQSGHPDQIPAIRRYRRLFEMPYLMSQLVHRRMTRSPEFYVGNVGTCGLTIGEGGWYENFLPIAPTTAVFGIGVTRSEPVVRHGRVEIARRLHCALMADNFVLSGLAAGRLGHDFKQLLESGDFVSAELNERAAAQREDE